MKQNQFAVFNSYPELVVAISEKNDGNCRLVATNNEAINILTESNRVNVMTRIGVAPNSVVTATLVHGAAVHHATTLDAGSTAPNVDALISSKHDLFLSITVADCLPIFFFDPVTKAVGIAHAGWRGIEANIINATINRMKEECNINVQTMLVAVGPGIDVCHFEVQADVAQKFNAFPSAIIEREGKLFVHLKAIAREQLVSAGIKEENITISNECTFDLSETYFSYRRDKPEIKETMMAVIGWRTK